MPLIQPLRLGFGHQQICHPMRREFACHRWWRNWQGSLDKPVLQWHGEAMKPPITTHPVHFFIISHKIMIIMTIMTLTTPIFIYAKCLMQTSLEILLSKDI